MTSIDFKNNTKTSERGHLTTSYLPEVTVQNHVLDSFSQNIYQFAIKSYGPYFQQQQTHICYFMRNKKSLPKYLIHEKFKMSAFLISSPENGQIFQLFTLYSKGRHFCITKLDILFFFNILHLEIDFTSFFINLLAKVS